VVDDQDHDQSLRPRAGRPRAPRRRRAVARYWPEFAANGRRGCWSPGPLAHLGRVGWAQPVTVEDIFDWERSTAMLAAQAPCGSRARPRVPRPQPGTSGGEVLRRIDGRSLGRFFAEEVAGPLGGDFHIGLDPSDDHRVSDVIAPRRSTSTSPRSTWTAWRSRPLRPGPRRLGGHTTAWRRAEIGAANGHGNARSVARIQAVVANGGTLDGVSLLSPSTVDLIFREQSNGVDLVLGLPLRFGIGYGLTDPETFAFLPSGRVCTGVAGRVGHHRRRGAPPDHRLCDEQDGGRPGGRPARVQPRDRCLRGAGALGDRAEPTVGGWRRRRRRNGGRRRRARCGRRRARCGGGPRAVDVVLGGSDVLGAAVIGTGVVVGSPADPCEVAAGDDDTDGAVDAAWARTG